MLKKLSALLLFVFMLSGMIGNAQNITLKSENMTIKQFLTEIEAASGYTFAYDNTVIDVAQSVSVPKGTMDVVTMVESVLAANNYTIQVVNNQIIITPAQKQQAKKTSAAKILTVKGVVKDSKSGEGIPFASIVVKGAFIGIAADENGAFSLSDVPSDGVLEVSSIGYITAEYLVNGKTEINVSLKMDELSLEETIIVAYGTSKKGSLTGSAGVIDTKSIEKRVLSNISRAVEGTVPGVLMTSGTGQPGAAATMNIRGYGSINASQTPLYVVDGIPFDGSLNSINPADVESMTILKDASSGALYGARGANGVVMITTKKGQSGKLQVSYTGSVGWSNKALKLYDVVDQRDYVQLTYESLRNNFVYTNNLDWEGASLAAKEALSDTFGGEIYNPFKNYTWETLIGADGYIHSDAVSSWNENWLDDGILQKNALRQEHRIGVTGGTDNLKAMFSFGYTNDNGILKTSSFERFNVRTNIDATINPWIAAGINASFAHTKTSFLDTQGNSYGNHFLYARRAAPIYPIYEKDLNGNTVLDELGNPKYDYGETRPIWPGASYVALLFDDPNNNRNMNNGIRSYLRLGSDDESAGWAKGIKLTVNFGLDNLDSDQMLYNNMYNGNYASSKGRLRKSFSRTTSYTLNELLTYNRTFSNHTIDLLAGHEYYKYQYYNLSGTKTNLVDGIYELRPGTAGIESDSYSSDYAIESFLSRLNYNYKEKYYFSASLRRDGSSRFYKENRWGNFWSVGGNWRMTKEEFMQSVTFIDNINIKASYGVQGNDDLSTYYAWQSFYNLSWPDGSDTGAIVTSLENKNVTWEKNANFNVGADVRMFNGKLDLTVEWFNRKTYDMLLNFPMALSTGFTGYDANVGEMVNKGIEFSISSVLVDKQNFNLRATLMGTSLKNKLLKLTSESDSFISGSVIYKEGMPIRTFYMAKTAGVDPDTGAQLFWVYDETDENGEPINPYKSDDVTKATASKWYQGDRTPLISGSFGLDMTIFSDFEVSLLTTYSLGGKIYDSVYNGMLIPSQYGWAISSTMLGRWQKPGDVTDVPRMSIATTSIPSDQSLIDASYFTIKNISVAYNLPKRFSQALNISSAKVYVSLDNLKSFNHLNGMNPQNNFTGTTASVYIPARTSTIGLKLNF